MIDTPEGMRSLGDTDVLTLQSRGDERRQVARDLSAIVWELRGSYGHAAMPEGLPAEPHDMSRADMLAAVRKYQHLFDPPELRGAG